MTEDWSGEYIRINTWSRIAAYLGEDLDTVQAWAQERDLPVYHWPGGSRGGVFAYTADLDRWMRDKLGKAPRQPHAADTGNARVDGGLTEQIVATQASVQPEIQKPGASSRPAGSVLRQTGRRGTRGFLTLAAAAFVAVLAAALLHSFEGVSAAELPQRSWRRLSSLTPAALQSFWLVSPSSLLGRAAFNTRDRGPHREPRPQAVALYKEGRSAWTLRTPQALEFAKQRFQQAIQLDPEYPQAYTGLADSYLLMRQYGRMPSNEAFPLAEAAARKAVALNDRCSEAHRSMAFVLSYWKWDMAAAEKEFQRALELNPNDAEAHHWYATSLMHRGRFPEALTQIEIARTLEPTSHAIAANRGLILMLSGDRERGPAALRELEARDPEFLMPHLYLADEYLRRRDDIAFLKEEATLARLRGDRDLATEVQKARSSLKSGGHESMLRTLARDAAVSADGGGDAFRAAFYGILSQDGEAALRYLKISYDRHEPTFVAIEYTGDFAPLRTDPQFRALQHLADVHT